MVMRTESTARVMSAIAEERLHIINDHGQPRYYIIPEHLIEAGGLRPGIAAQLTLMGWLDYFEGEELVGRAPEIKIPEPDEEFVLSFVKDLIDQA